MVPQRKQNIPALVQNKEMARICGWGPGRACHSSHRVRPLFPPCPHASHSAPVLAAVHSCQDMVLDQTLRYWKVPVCVSAIQSRAMHASRPKTRHHSLALYILLRGITLLVRCGNKPDAPPAVRKLLTITRMKHGDTALMCACTSQVLTLIFSSLTEALVPEATCTLHLRF